jgi:hypothetical protein
MKENPNRFDNFRQVLLFLRYFRIWNITLEMTLLKHSYNFLYFSDKFALYLISIINVNFQLCTCSKSTFQHYKTEVKTSNGSGCWRCEPH